MFTDIGENTIIAAIVFETSDKIERSNLNSDVLFSEAHSLYIKKLLHRCHRKNRIIKYTFPFNTKKYCTGCEFPKISFPSSAAGFDAPV
jgi:hypothetical protein